MSPMQLENLFWALYRCNNEGEVEALIQSMPDAFKAENWRPLGDSKSNFSIVENQQSNPVAALTEKLTNAMDAILVRKCLEARINPEGLRAPRSTRDAVEQFFPQHNNWDLQEPRNEQARAIQILAHGTRDDTSLVVYDDGEGQHPRDFPDTFLSLMRGNKQGIKFVHGRYNMGGTGAIVFCGKRRFQLVASKRYDGTGLFGFTLVREHPLSQEEANSWKDPWYEYLTLDGAPLAFNITTLDLGLHRRSFCTGTFIKLYSYDLHGVRHLIRSLAPSVNQHLYNPALPFLIVESSQRYTRTKDDYVVSNYGLVRRLKQDKKYVDDQFSVEIDDPGFGKVKVSVFVFRRLIEGRTAAETKDTLADLFMRQGKRVLFTVAGQVHGHYTGEFISRTLKMTLLRDYTLIHVDCTDTRPEFRRELFMASRDRLKQSEEAAALRKTLGETLRNSKLRDIFKQRKDRLSYDNPEDNELLKQLGSELPFDKEMQELVKQIMQLDVAGELKQPKPARPKPDPNPFVGNRYPSYFHLDRKKPGKTSIVEVQRGSSKSIQFASDVEDAYFDRAEDPGGLELAVLDYRPKRDPRGVVTPTPDDISDYFAVTRSSPEKGKIRVVLEPSRAMLVGDEVQIRANLQEQANPDDLPPAMFWVRITEPTAKPKPKPKPEPKLKNLGLPKPVRVYRKAPDGATDAMTWDKFNDEYAETMDQSLVMYPYVPGEKLERIFINMHSDALRRFKQKRRNPSAKQSALADRQYVSRVYYHALFLYVISKQRQYAISRLNGSENYDEVELADYIKDVFSSNYGAFLLNFETSALMEGLG